MRIKSLHIENFGGLHDHNEVFEGGLNVRQRPNGWGKSTLAVFIKAMLYGLPVTTKRSLIENERKRYTPWQGGVFGGSLDIEVGDECYRIERSFGAKEAEDTLSVISLRTGGTADVEWANHPGEGLFGVDAAAYERSTYLSQRPEEMTKDGSVSIHTKLNRLVDATDDLANYDSAMELLEKRRKQLRHLTGGGGEIADIEARMAALDRDIEKSLAQRSVLAVCRERIAHLKDNIDKARTEEREVQDKLSRELHLREGRAVGQRLAALQAEEAELTAALAECREAFGGQEPSERMIESVSATVASLEETQRKLDATRMDEEEISELQALSARFERGVPSKEMLEELRLAARNYNRASVLSMDQESQGAPKQDADPEVQFLEARADLIALKKQRQDLAQSGVQAKTKRVDPISLGMLVLAVVFAIVAVWYPFLGIVGGACLVGALVFAVLHIRRCQKIATEAEQNKQKIAQLDEQIKQAELYQQAAESAVRFAKLWRRAYAEEPLPCAGEAALAIERLAAQGERLSALLEKQKQTELSRRACRHALDEVQAHLLTQRRQLKGAPEDTARLVRWMSEVYSRYRDALARKERKQAEIASLLEQYRADGVPAAAAQNENAVDAVALEARQAELATALAQWSEALAREEQTEARLTTEVEELDEQEAEREALGIDLEQKKEHLATIQSAQKYLKEAKENLSGRYLDAMQSSFGAYLGELTGEDAPVFTMDAQFRVKLRAAGLSRETEAFSTGVRDLISLCERLSLVDAMFEGERPFLILDDPFANLDDDTILRASALIERVAERYQVLYLTCHSGRVIENVTSGE